MAMPERSRRDATKLYYSISEVAELVNVKPHVLRYWETQFKMLRPRKNRAGNRSYRAKEVQLAMRIKRLLYDEGFTIAGARRKLLDERRSGQAQTELDFVGLSQGEFLDVLRRDLQGLLSVVRGEKPFETLVGDEVESAVAAGEAGLLREVGAMADESSADKSPEDEPDTVPSAVAPTVARRTSGEVSRQGGGAAGAGRDRPIGERSRSKA
jgi:DNA-binding transcriptional MerR regulator